MATLTITTDKPAYTPTEPIVVTFEVTPPAATQETITVSGSVTEPDGTHLPATTTVVVGTLYELDPVTGYTAAQTGPAEFTLTPDA